MRVAYLVPGRGRRGGRGAMECNAGDKEREACKHQTHYALVGAQSNPWLPKEVEDLLWRFSYMLGFGQVAYPSNSNPLFFFFFFLLN